MLFRILLYGLFQLALLIIPLIFPHDSSGNWGASGLCAVQGAVAPVGEAPLRWQKWDESPDQLFLLQGDRTLGAWDYAGKYYRAFLGGEKWGPSMDKPPFPLPEQPDKLVPPINAQPLKAWQLDGVRKDLVGPLTGGAAKHSINGQVVLESDAHDAIGGKGPLADDAGKLWLVAAFEDAKTREQIVRDIQADPELSKWAAERLRMWAGPAASPSHALMKTRDGQPRFEANSLGLLDKDGFELWHQAGYKGVADIQALRKADPTYSPDLSPGPNKKKPEPAAAPADDGTILIVFFLLAGAAGLFWFTNQPTTEEVPNAA